jgi:hypothetical protein
LNQPTQASVANFTASSDRHGPFRVERNYSPSRAMKLRAAGYVVHTQTIPGSITPKNRLLLGEPREAVRRRPA